MKYKLHISISGLSRMRESQRAIKRLQEKYDKDDIPGLKGIRVTPFNNGYIKGINLTIPCESREQAKGMKELFNEAYQKEFLNSWGRLVKFTSLLDVDAFRIYRF